MVSRPRLPGKSESTSLEKEHRLLRGVVESWPSTLYRKAGRRSRRSTGRTLYILDEPTTGLHFHDVAQLLDVLHELVDQGNTMIVIEHNLEVVKTADWVVDMGPEGGDGGGEVVAEGTPEQIARNPKSYTGQYLKPVLARKAKGGRRAAE